MTRDPGPPIVVGATVIGPHLMRLLFDDGLVRDIRFVPGEGVGPLVRDLDDAEYFAQVHVDTDAGTVVWPNGLDLAPEVLHGDSEPEHPMGFHGVTAARLTA